jgi:hypothetical protein
MTDQKSTLTQRPVKGATNDPVESKRDNIINTLHYLTDTLQNETDEDQSFDYSSIAGLRRILQGVEEDAQTCFADYQASQR